MPAVIEIYTRPGCGYCGAAKSLLTRKKAAFVEFDVAKDPALREEMWDRAGAGSTYPQIFIGKIHVGGCDELYALDRQGKLHAVLAGAKGPSLAPPSPLPPPPCTRRAPPFRHTTSCRPQNKI